MPNFGRFWTVDPIKDPLPPTWGLEYVACGVFRPDIVIEKSIPFWRFVLPGVNAHFWTHDLTEPTRDESLSHYQREGIACRLFDVNDMPADAAQFLIPLYRYQDLNGQPGNQFFWSVSNQENVLKGAPAIDTGLRVFNWIKDSKVPVCGDQYANKSSIVPFYRFHDQVGTWCVHVWFKNGGAFAGSRQVEGTKDQVIASCGRIIVDVAVQNGVGPGALYIPDGGGINPGKC